MSIDLATEYTNAEASSAQYPGGSFKNEVTPGSSGDGTPVEKVWADDIWGFLRKFIENAGITVSGTKDTVLASDRWDGMMACLNSMYVDTGSANDYEVSLISGATVDEYYNGMMVAFMANTDNTGASTLEIDSLGVKDLVYHDGTALTGQEIKEDRLVICRYDASSGDFFLLNPNDTYAYHSGTVVTGTTAESSLREFDVRRYSHKKYTGLRFQVRLSSTNQDLETLKFYFGSTSLNFGNNMPNDTDWRIMLHGDIFFQDYDAQDWRLQAKYSTSSTTANQIVENWYTTWSSSGDLNAGDVTMKITTTLDNVANSVSSYDFIVEFF